MIEQRVSLAPVVSDDEQGFGGHVSALDDVLPNRVVMAPTTHLSAMAGNARAEPLSIEALLQKQKAEKDSAAKVCSCERLLGSYSCGFHSQPKFLSKEERAKIAIAKRAAELKEQRGREEKARQDRDVLEREADALRQREREKERTARYGGTPRRKLFFLHCTLPNVDYLVQKTTRRGTVTRKRIVVMEDGTGEAGATSRTTVVLRRLPNHLGVALKTSRLVHAQIASSLPMPRHRVRPQLLLHLRPPATARFPSPVRHMFPP